MAVARGGPPRRQRGTESWTTIWKKPWDQARTRHSVRSFISSDQFAYLEQQIGNTQSEQKTNMIKCVALNQDSLSLRARKENVHMISYHRKRALGQRPLTFPDCHVYLYFQRLE